jgi:hypothetical protein
MQRLDIYDPGDRVKIEMVIESRYFENGDIKYILKDPRRMGKTVDYPFVATELELIEGIQEKEGEE